MEKKISLEEIVEKQVFTHRGQRILMYEDVLICMREALDAALILASEEATVKSICRDHEPDEWVVNKQSILNLKKIY